MAKLKTFYINTTRGKENFSLKKARKKYVTNGLMLHLRSNNPYTPLYRSYSNTFFCSNTLHFDEEGKPNAYRCKNRFCMTCNAIRTAHLIDWYYPQLKALKNPYFVTLTLPNCDATIEAFRATKNAMYRTFTQIVHILKNNGIRYKMLRKFEATINEQKREFHPHFHIIVEGADIARFLIDEWLKHLPSANRDAQNMERANSGSMLELFKYFTKLFTKGENGKRRLPDAELLDTLLCVIKGVRTFTAYGIKAIKEDKEIEQSEEFKALANKVFTWYKSDWIDEESGECLTGYEPTDEIRVLLGVNNGVEERTPK